MEMLIPTSRENLSATDFQKVLQSERDNIASVKFIPPKIGQRGFGKFEVNYRVTVLRKANYGQYEF